MNKHVVLFLIIYLSFNLNGQVQLSGIINNYSKVTAIENDVCQNKITVTDTAPFDEGQFVVLIQMQGAEIDESNGTSFGDISSLNNAGLYEINEIILIDGQDIYLKYQTINDYDINGKVQLINMPNYTDAQIDNTLTAEAWDGDTGGVLALKINGQLLMNANIDVSGLGFRGGEKYTASNNNCTWLFQQNDFYYEFGNWRGASKGEGVAPIILDKEFGKGAQANGGGGGNDHNSGGGGGGNVTNGGAGGENDEPSTFGCQGNHPGLGGKGITNIDNRIFLGGGGGAGHDNNEVATNGANGGGIVILMVEDFVPAGFSILANGNTTVDGGGDGAGGGGAGGTILIETQTLNSTIHLEAIGGNGGLIQNGGGDRCHGPGGGGSGGRIISNLMTGSTFTTSIDGGDAGMSLNSSTCPDGTNGAENGQDGLVETVNNIVLANEDFLNPEADFSFNNNMLTVDFTNLSQNGNTVNWDFGDNNMSDENDPSHTYFQSGTYQVQLVVSNACGSDTLIQQIMVEIVEANFAIDQNAGCATHTVNFQDASLGTINSFLWTFEGGNPMTSTDANPQVTYDIPGLYDVQLEVYGAQGNDTILIVDAIEIVAPPVASFDFMSIQPNQYVVNFNNLSTGANSFEWNFGDGSPIVTTEMPFHEYDSLTQYVVTLTAYNDYCSTTFSDTVFLLFVEVNNLELSDLHFFPNPADNFITIELQKPEKAEYEVLSATGKKIIGLNGTFLNSKTLYIKELPSGIYFLSISQNGKRGIFRWVKMK